MQKITPFLWFDKEAAQFYTAIFKNSKIHIPTLRRAYEGESK